MSDYIAHEVRSNQLALVPLAQSPHVRCNPIGLIPKPNQPGKFRLTVNLSAPVGFSVSDAIDPDSCTLCYTTVAEVARLVALSGPGTLLAKLDLQSAYWQVPVHPADQPHLGNVQPLSTRRCHSGCDRHPLYSQPWWIASPGQSTARGLLTSFTTWMTFSYGQNLAPIWSPLSVLQWPCALA